MIEPLFCTVVQVPQKARAALHVHEAQLALLLQLVRTILQSSGAMSGSGYRLAAVDIINHLTRCQVPHDMHFTSHIDKCMSSRRIEGIPFYQCGLHWAESYKLYLHGGQAVDLQPEEPRAGLRSSDTALLRVRLSRFNTAVLRIVAADVAGLPDSEQVPQENLQFSKAHQCFLPQWQSEVCFGIDVWAWEQVRQAAAGFVEAHDRTLDRILGEAASLGSKGWQPGEQELEAATLVLQLLARLVPYHQKHPSSAAIDLRIKAYQ